jgi:organic hydroperoxide reductase OsmC/OhrA
MITYPVRFTGKASAPAGMQESWATTASEQSFGCAIPEAFEGGGKAASPEDYFLLAVMNCFMATFKVYATYSKFDFTELGVDAVLLVDKSDEGRPCMHTVELDVRLTGATRRERAQLLVDKTLANGFILQSLKTRLTVSLTYLD